MSTNYNTFKTTLAGLSQGLQVHHIATFDVKTCSPNDSIESVFAQFPEFDQVPVKENDCVTGVVERDRSSNVSVIHQIRRLDDGILVANNQSLLDFIPLMGHPPFYRLVLSGSRVNGIVTRSDLLKLPVRLLGFAMVTNLELIMKEIIAQRLPNDADWFGLLSVSRQKKVMDNQVQYQRMHSDLSLLELTYFCDKKTIIKKHLKISSPFEKELIEIENLRNLIAHAGNYAPGESGLHDFITYFAKAHYWIDSLSKYLG